MILIWGGDWEFDREYFYAENILNQIAQHKNASSSRTKQNYALHHILIFADIKTHFIFAENEVKRKKGSNQSETKSWNEVYRWNAAMLRSTTLLRFKDHLRFVSIVLWLCPCSGIILIDSITLHSNLGENSKSFLLISTCEHLGVFDFVLTSYILLSWTLLFPFLRICIQIYSHNYS